MRNKSTSLHRQGFLLHVVVLMSWAAISTGCALIGQGSKSSQQKITKASKIYVKDLASKRVGQVSRSSRCPKSSKQVKTENWKLLVKQANACVAKGNSRMVATLATVLSEKHHNSPWGPYFRSLLAEKRGELFRAAWMIDLALKKTPGKGLLLYQKGRLHWKQGQVNLAIDLFEEALEDDSSLVDANMMLAQIYYRDQEYDTAEKYFERVTNLDPSRANAFIGLAECQLEDDNPKDAVASFDKAIKLKPDMLRLRMRQAKTIEDELEDFALALAKYKKIYRLGQRKKLDQPVTENLGATIQRLKVKVSQENPGEKVSKRQPAAEEVQK